MKAILIKIKDKIVWILGGIIAILGIILAVDYEKKKIKKLKTELIMVKTKNELGLSEVHSGEVKGREEILKKQADALKQKIEQDSQEITDAKKVVDRSITDIVDGLNKRYGRTDEGND